MFRCNACPGYGCKPLEEVMVHVKMEHLDDYRPFECALCGAKRAESGKMAEHMKFKHGSADGNEYRCYYNLNQGAEECLLNLVGSSEPERCSITANPGPSVVGVKAEGIMMPAIQVQHQQRSDFQVELHTGSHQQQQQLQQQLQQQQQHEQQASPSMQQLLHYEDGSCSDQAGNDDVANDGSLGRSAMNVHGHLNEDDDELIIGETPIKRRVHSDGREEVFKQKVIRCKKCQVANHYASRSDHIAYHMRRELGLVRFSCKICNKKDIIGAAVKRHALRVHPGLIKQYGNPNNAVSDNLSQDFLDNLAKVAEECYGKFAPSYDNLHEELKGSKKRIYSAN